MTYASPDDQSDPSHPGAAQNDAIRRLQARVDRERSARKQAESLLEEKSRALYQTNQALSDIANALESRVKERTAELNSAMQEARSANEAKSRFLALMSHEIRTPLNGVLGLSELLSTTVLDESQSTYIKSILSAGNALLVVINDILDFSKIEAGEMTLERMEFDPIEIVREALDLMQVQVQHKDVSLELCITKPLPVRMMGDPTRIRQVLLNLVGNAIKFTSNGRVTISLHASLEQLSCSVQDSGIGMSPTTVEGLFEPFRQADNSIARKFGGTGLGLVICKSLIEKMQGRLQVSSVEGMGSCFTFVLPLHAQAWAHATSDASRTDHEHPNSVQDLFSESDQSLFRILLVDDHPINRLMARSQLKQLGFMDVDEAHNGLQALDQLRAKPYDLVLMDLQMPEMDGLDATRSLRRMEIEQQPVVIAMTANAFSEDREACLGAGMNYFLTKPVRIDTLRTTLHKVMNGRIRSE